MTPEEEATIRRWGEALGQDIRVHLLTTPDERSVPLERFCESLAALAPAVRVETEAGDEGAIPGIRIGERIHYHGVPMGTELSPFLEALTAVSGSSQAERGLEAGGDRAARLAGVDHPSPLMVFVSPHCPNCPTAVRRLVPMAIASRNVHLSVVDCGLFPELVERHRVQSVPTVLLDDSYRWVGPIDFEELLAVMVERDPLRLGAASLQRLLEDGAASEVARMMLAADRLFPAFFDLLAHEALSVRLGAMVAMEEVLEERPELAALAVEPIWDRFPAMTDPARGDALYLIGEAGDPAAAGRLQSVIGGDYDEEVREAAREALERIDERHG